MGRGWFIGAIFILSFATYIMAIYIQNILDFVKLATPLEEEQHKSEADKIPNMWKWFGSVLPYRRVKSDDNDKDQNRQISENPV